MSMMSSVKLYQLFCLPLNLNKVKLDCSTVPALNLSNPKPYDISNNNCNVY